MEEKDLIPVLEIERAAFTNPWHFSSFQGEIDNYDISFPYVVIHSRDGRIMGYIIFWLINDEAQISNFAIHPDYRGRGLGEEVLSRILDLIQKRGGKEVILEVRPTNMPARLLYTKFGFKAVGIRKQYYDRPREDALLMGKVFESKDKSEE
jgi:ribosomal-protein-alanine N-acetyltransferase